MNANEIEEYARKAGQTPREYCLEQIHEWKMNLRAVSDDYVGLDEEEFEELVEREIDSWRRVNDCWEHTTGSG